MKITILGSGSSGGVPLIGNYWGECDPNNPKNIRTRVSVLVTLDNKKNILIDTSPDLRMQSINNNIKNLSAKVKGCALCEASAGLVVNYFSNKKEVIGRKTKVTLREGQILRERHIEKNWTIQEGQKIIIENNRSKIQILIEGIALNSAMAGDYVEVLNKSTGKPVKAWVKNNKKVSIFR